MSRSSVSLRTLETTPSVDIKRTLKGKDMDRTNRLGQNYPNPAIHSTTIPYSISENAKEAMLQIINIDGKVVWQQTISNKENTITLNVKSLTPGMYFYQLKEDSEYSDIKKLVVSH